LHTKVSSVNGFDRKTIPGSRRLWWTIASSVYPDMYITFIAGGMTSRRLANAGLLMPGITTSVSIRWMGPAYWVQRRTASSPSLAASEARSRTLARLYAEDTLLQQLARDLQHMTPELGKFIQTEYAVVRQRYVPRHRQLAPGDQP
jgi:hypothetical protein